MLLLRVLRIRIILKRPLDSTDDGVTSVAYGIGNAAQGADHAIEH